VPFQLPHHCLPRNQPGRGSKKECTSSPRCATIVVMQTTNGDLKTVRSGFGRCGEGRSFDLLLAMVTTACVGLACGSTGSGAGTNGGSAAGGASSTGGTPSATGGEVAATGGTTQSMGGDVVSSGGTTLAAGTVTTGGQVSEGGSAASGGSDTTTGGAADGPADSGGLPRVSSGHVLSETAGARGSLS